MSKYLEVLHGFAQQLLPSASSDGGLAPEPTLADTFKAPVTVLSGRANALRRVAVVASLIAVAAGTVAVLCSLGGWLALPSADLHGIDIPRHVADIFEPAQHATGMKGDSGDEGVASLRAATTDLFSFVSPLCKVLGGVMLIFGIFQLAAGRGVLAILPAMFMFGAPSVIEGVVGSESASQRESHHEVNPLTEAAKDKDYTTLKRLLHSNDQIDEFSKAYVLAQAAILSHVKEPAVMENVTKDLRSEELASLSRKSSPGKPAFTIDPQIAYAIEKATDGMVSNQAASRFADDALRTVNAWHSARWFATLVCVFFCVVAIGPLTLSKAISSRLKRLDVLFRQADTL